MKRSKRPLKAALFSGALSFGLLWLSGDMPNWLPIPDHILRFSPGLVFGVLVLANEARGHSAAWLRGLAVIGCSATIYFLMVQLANHIGESHISPLAACGIAGGIGALLTALTLRVLVARSLSLLAILMGFVLGTLGGCLIGQAILTPEMDSIVQLLVLSGFLLWQGGVGFSLLMVDPLGDEQK